MVLARYDLGLRIIFDACFMLVLFTAGYLGMAFSCLLVFQGFLEVISFVFFVGIWIALSSHSLVRAIRFVELTENELRWANVIRRNSRPLDQVVSICCAEVFVVRVGRHDRVTVKFTDEKTIVFKPAVSGLEEFMDKVRIVAPNVEVSLSS